jgi:vanillate O-demethylase ferredoxin subunit
MSAAEISSVRDLTEDIRMFEIARQGGFPPAAPGAHLEIGVVIEGRAATRAYSIVEATPEGAIRIAVKRLKISRGGSAYMMSLRPGARVSVSGPRNHFPMALGAGEYLLIAGGIGVTPIYSHALALGRAGERFRLLYAARAAFALGDELRAVVGERLRTFNSAAGERIDFAAEFAALASNAEAYVCGPVGMLEAAKRAWAAAGRPMHRLRFETFGASGLWPTSAFEVKLPRLGKRVAVAETKTLLEALEEAGVEAMSDCRKGECGLCALPILGVDGVIDHRDVFFDDAEKATGEKLCACVSRVYGASVTLDIAGR